MPEEAGELVLVQPNVMSAAKRYLADAGLPNEALPAVIQTAQAHFAMEKLIAHQVTLSAKGRANLVSVAPGNVITELRLAEIDQFVQMQRFPYNTLYIAKDGNIAIRASGWRMKAQADARIFKAWETTPTEIIHLEDGDILFRKSVTAIFWTGERFSAEGAACQSELQARRKDTKAPPSFTFMVSETRAKVRAWRDAIGLPYDIAEDVMAGEAQRDMAIVPVEAARPATPTTGVVKFLAECKKLGLTVPDILARLGIANLGAIKSYDEALEKLRKETDGTQQ